MNKVITGLLFAICVSLLYSCSSKEDKTEIKIAFPNYKWNRFAPMDTTFVVSNINRTYDVSVGLSVLDGFEHSRVPVEIVITSPDGQENIINKVIVLKDENNKYTGAVYGDVWTVEQSIYSHKEFMEEGTYRVFIQNRTQYYDLFKTVSLSFIISPSKPQK
jgi:gliding motility-associated lipoprotein GldH